jgi:hypothetical protein
VSNAIPTRGTLANAMDGWANKPRNSWATRSSSLPKPLLVPRMVRQNKGMGKGGGWMSLGWEWMFDGRPLNSCEAEGIGEG